MAPRNTSIVERVLSQDDQEDKFEYFSAKKRGRCSVFCSVVGIKIEGIVFRFSFFYTSFMSLDITEDHS